MDAIAILQRLALEFSDGHFTIMRFTTNWRVGLGTPDLDSGEGREEIKRWPTGATLEQAVIELMTRLDAEALTRILGN